jgi:membrane-associated phospholipid phosphatase
VSRNATLWRNVTTEVEMARGASQRVVGWAVVIASLIYALLFARYNLGGAAAYLLALLPCVLAYIVSRTWLASAFMFLLPMYFVIGQITAAQPHYQPFTWLDRVMPLSPAWIGVYASLYMCAFLLPLVVVRSRELFVQTMKAYIFVMVVSYAFFVVYPTTAPRSGSIAVNSFSTWALQLFYDIDQPYGCFPSLHVAYSFIGALACYRMHRGVGTIAAAWSVLIALSTVYTKQHFAVDAIAGIVEGFAANALFLRGRPRQPLASHDQQLAPRRAIYVVGGYLATIAVFWIAYRLGLGPASS